MLSRPFFQEALQLNHVKHKQVPPQVVFATLTHDDRMKLKPVHYLVKHETVRLSLKDDCYPGLAHFGNDQFPLVMIMKEKKMLLKHWIPFRLMVYVQSKFHLKNQSRKTLKRYFNNFFLIVLLRIRLGVENHETVFPSELIWF